MSKSHNKRRNAGLLYEFLVRSISRALIEGDKKKSTTALRLLKRHFKPGTELYREFRLINALVRTTVSAETVASSILGEAKDAARSYNLESLDREKSILLRNINHYLGDENFYDQHIHEYKAYATAQTLLNNWRIPGKDKDISALALYEDQMSKWLMSEKVDPANEVSITSETPGMTRLLMKVMTKKLNEKYAISLDEDQKSLLKTYIFSTANSDPAIISRKLHEVKSELVGSINGYTSINPENTYLTEKMSQVKGQLLSESLDLIDDNTVTRFMMYMKLNKEIGSEE
jgi:hypothetical protein